MDCCEDNQTEGFKQKTFGTSFIALMAWDVFTTVLS